MIGVDLLGHGEAPKPHDPAAYSDLTERVADALPDEPVDAIGFSLGALTLLRLAIRRPNFARRLVLGGIGRNVFETDDEQRRRMIAGIEGSADDDDVAARAFAGYAHAPGNDPVALAAVLRAGGRPLAPGDLTAVTCQTLVVIGEHDFAGPGDPLAAALPNADLKVLRKVDHFATPESFAFIDAALDFVGAVPV